MEYNLQKSLKSLCCTLETKQYCVSVILQFKKERNVSLEEGWQAVSLGYSFLPKPRKAGILTLPPSSTHFPPRKEPQFEKQQQNVNTCISLWSNPLHLPCCAELLSPACNTTDCNPPGPSVLGDSPGKNTGAGCHALLQRIFPTQGSNQHLLCLLHCRWILYQLSHQGRPRVLERVAHPFSGGAPRPRNQTGISRIAGGFFTI